jgi:hypothetical protein
MKLITEKEAKDLYCPAIERKCLGDKCMSFDLVHANITRENHSGGKQMMMDHRSKRGYQELRFEGHGCSGLIILDALYRCANFYPEEKQK